jgi:hypothetical protein
LKRARILSGDNHRSTSKLNWALTFWISGAIYFLGGLCWLWVDPVTPIPADEKETGMPGSRA